MKKKLLSILLCVAMVASMLMGCSSKTEKEPETKDPTSTETDDTLNTEEPITLKILSTLITETEGPMEQAMADAYMAEHKNVTIELIGQPVNEMAKKIVALNTSGDLPDAFFMPTEFMAQAHDMEIIVDHEALLGTEYISSLTDNVVEFGKIDEQLMMVPWHVIPVALIYRTDWLAETGIEKIETIDDFKAVAKAFTKDGHWGFSMVGTQNGSGEARFTQYARAFGVNEVYKNDAGEWVSDLTSDKYKAALQSFVDLVLVDGVVPTGATETGYPEASAYFAQEKTGLMITGSNAIGAIEGANPELKGKLGSIAMPMQERHVTNLQTSGYAITTACKNPEVMADYLKFITNKKFAVDFGVKSGRLPVTKEAAADPAFQTDTFKGFVECMQYALPSPAFAAFGEILDVMGESYNSMIGNNVSIDDAMAQVKTRVEGILADNQ
ncbi:MAG: ABC transporter substrate-binding protein [Mobilitalea sp.]